MLGRRVLLVLLALVLVATRVGVSGAAASAQAGKPVSYFFEHPCDLITRGQAAAVVGVALMPGIPRSSFTGTSCAYYPTSTAAFAQNRYVSYGFSQGSEAAVKGALGGEATHVEIFGRPAYCHNGYLDVAGGRAHGQTFHLGLSADNCRDAFKLADLALARIS